MAFLTVPHTPFAGTGNLFRKPASCPSLESGSEGSSYKSSRLSLPTRKGRRPTFSARAVITHHYDVVVIGAGIIGLTIARQILLWSDLSVAVVDKAVPCAGATGAGQGYIWMVHKSPDSTNWDLALRSRRLWENFAAGVGDQGLDPLHELGWKKTGSLLIGRTSMESDLLKTKVKKLAEAGLSAEFLDAQQLNQAEPELAVWEDGGAAFLPDDCQIDAQSTVSFILNNNRAYASKGRYAEFFHNPVTSLIRNQSSGEVEAVVTDMNTLNVKRAAVIATGCWSGSLMNTLFGNADVSLDVPVKPRKGHLLVMENLWPLKLRHGLMEASYVNHEHILSDSDTINSNQMLSISMTATMDSTDNILLGSSRQFAGFSTEVEDSIVNHIWNHAKAFFPKLQNQSLDDTCQGRKVRVGLRPYMAAGKPVIDRVPTFSNLFIAAGHEGEGLSLALGTAEMIANMVLQRPATVDNSPFSFRR